MFKRLAWVMMMMVIAFSLGAPVFAQESDPLGGATEFAALDERTTVTLMLDWTPNTNHTGFYVAQALGFYDEANLAVSIQEPTDLSVEAIVTSGTAQFGVGYQEVMTYARAEGLPVVSVAAIIQHNTSGFVTLGDQDPVVRPSDLAGLRYGGFGQPDLENAMIDTLIVCDDGAAGSVAYVDVGWADGFELMERDRIDFAWMFYAWTGISGELRGFDLDAIMLQDYADCVPDYYTPILLTSEDLIAEQPEVVAAFVQATARGYAAAIADPSQAAAILLEAAPELDAELVETSAAWLADQYQADASRWGEQSADVWQGFTAFLVENGILAETIDTEAAFTNAFLPGSRE